MGTAVGLLGWIVVGVLVGIGLFAGLVAWWIVDGIHRDRNEDD